MEDLVKIPVTLQHILYSLERLEIKLKELEDSIEPKGYLNTSNAAKYCDRDAKAIKASVKAGELQAYKPANQPNGNFYFKISDLETYYNKY